MAISEQYRDQVRLLMRLLPLVAVEQCFALKGGTAINLFIRNLPRLSVDIDLMYLPLHGRANALSGTDVAMKRIKAETEKQIPGVHVATTEKEGAVIRLIVSSLGARVKIEVSPVLRGVVREPVLMAVSEAVEDAFGFAEIKVVSFEDLYAGKLVAALDRQHPRDLFDVRDLLANEGLTSGLREVFLVYLLSHNRPMWEVLSGREKNLENEFANSFRGMTVEDISLETLAQTRAQLLSELVDKMPIAHREFLVGFEAGQPKWDVLDIKHVEDLPAIQWRQKNLDDLDNDKRAVLVSELKKILRLS